jgi:hypothetical protein
MLNAIGHVTEAMKAREFVKWRYAFKKVTVHSREEVD